MLTKSELMTPPASPTLSARQRATIVSLDRMILAGSRHWLFIVNILFGAYALTPWLAPVLMHTGHTRAAGVIYFIYSTQCHQLPERSFFLFGQRTTYSLADIQAAWTNTNNPAILRQFIGNPEMGWKVAWSDRMVAMYTALFGAGLIFSLAPHRMRAKPLSLFGFAGLTLPMVVDGATHMLSDAAGIGRGFRDSNDWLAVLTGHAFAGGFYAGDTLGSFNSWMRLITGILFGIACVWLAYPYLEQFANETRDRLADKLQRAGVVH